MENTEIQLNLTVQQINVILNALGTQPYVSVASIVTAIQQQAQAQLSAKVAESQFEQAAE